MNGRQERPDSEARFGGVDWSWERHAVCIVDAAGAAADIYQRARDRGARHPHAVRILTRAWCRVIWRCWKDNTAYDPTRHGGLQQLQTAQG